MRFVSIRALTRAGGALASALLASCAVDDIATGTPPALAQQAAPTAVRRELPRSGVLRVAPARAGARYLRCGTESGETEWTPHVSADHRRLAVLTDVGTVRLIDAESFRELVELASPTGRIDAVAFAPDGRSLATVSVEEGQLALWDASDGRLLWSDWVRPHGTWRSFAGGLSFSRDGKQILSPLRTVTAVATGRTIAWDGSDASKHASGGIRPHPVRFGGQEDHAVVLNFSEESGAQTFHQLYWQQLGTPLTLQLARARTDAPIRYALSPDGRLLAHSQHYGANNVTLHVVGRPTPIAVASHERLGVTAFSPEGSELYLTDGNQVQVLSAQTLAARRAFAITPGSTFVGIAPGGAFVTTSKDGTSWWDPATGARLRTIPGALQRVSWSADGALGVATRSDALLVVFRESDGQVLLELPLFTTPVTPTSALPSPSGPPRNAASWPYDPLDAPAGVPAVVRQYPAGHFMAVDWSTCAVVDRATRKTIRDFPAVVSCRAAISDDGKVLRTLEAEGGINYLGGYVAVWCRDPVAELEAE